MAEVQEVQDKSAIHETGNGRSRKMAFGVVGVMACVVLIFGALVVALESYVKRNEEQSMENVAYTPAYDPFYVLLVGNDSRKETALYTGKSSEHAQRDQHADVLTLVRVDPTNYTVTLITVPRDTYLESRKCKISETLLSNRPEDVVSAVADLTGIHADYYLMTTFSGFVDLINAIGGIEVDVVQTVTEEDPITAAELEVEAGADRQLAGAEALVLARSRSQYEGFGEAVRQINVRNIERSMIERVLGAGVGTGALLLDLEQNITTNMGYDLIGHLISDFIANRGRITFFSCTGPYEGDFDSGRGGQWIIKEDSRSWQLIKELADAGEDPSWAVDDRRVR